ncbi:nucleotidyltransferase [Bacillus benzoevorans]|uniref:tRNA(Met) cytidine acetate ligase n=1 Tax=Bacillus benzoevorans TaxID=1456 RepID=A0A7X0LUM6_9BACI|nr:nucleotidyltransferase [Bacillus benzoevorans]MBB6443727.1 putative nucleotidyltransferase [Bacillus benzoevorans]
MKATGVIVEYNPFHYGHIYHLEQAKKVSGADVVIAAMSGNFLQRGEPALVSKWARTEMALNGGIDLVFELPYAFAVQKADTFANGAVSLLSAAGCSSICFGSESGDIEGFYDTYRFLNQHDEKYKAAIHAFLQQGNSYPKALSLAFASLEPDKHLIDLTKPNNILGFQYVTAAQKQQASLKMATIKRKNADYHDEQFTSSPIASATSIRKALFSRTNEGSAIQSYVPDDTYRLLTSYQRSFGSFHNWENYWSYIKLLLLQTTAEELKDIYEMEEGLENRFLALAAKAESFSEFMNALKTKRYTWTRLQRALTHILTRTKKTDVKMAEEKVSYLRLLGMTRNGRAYLNRYKKEISLPIIVKRASFDDPLIRLDSKAARIYAMGLPQKYRQKALELEFSQQPLYIEKK